MQQLFSGRVAERGDALAVVDPPNEADLVDTGPLRLSWAEVDARVEELAGGRARR